MSYYELPIRSDIPAYQYQVDLESKPYVLSFTYNARMNRWLMDILTTDGVQLIVGVPLLAGILLIDRFRSSTLPPGQFFLEDTQNGKDDPGRDDLGTRFKLIYRDSTTV